MECLLSGHINNSDNSGVKNILPAVLRTVTLARLLSNLRASFLWSTWFCLNCVQLHPDLVLLGVVLHKARLTLCPDTEWLRTSWSWPWIISSPVWFWGVSISEHPSQNLILFPHPPVAPIWIQTICQHLHSSVWSETGSYQRTANSPGRSLQETILQSRSVSTPKYGNGHSWEHPPKWCQEEGWSTIKVQRDIEEGWEEYEGNVWAQITSCGPC